MSRYTYTDRDLFDKPEYYHYAPCDRPDFLRDWRSARDILLEHPLVAPLPSGWPSLDELDSDATEPGTVAQVLAVGALELLKGRDANNGFEEALAILIRKYEVARRLFRRYDHDWKRIETQPVAGIGTYVLFAVALALRCERSSPMKLQMLSTLLKLGDALCSKSITAFSPGQLMAIRESFILERMLVAQVEEGGCSS